MCELEVQNREENLLPFTPALLISQQYPVLTDLTFRTTPNVHFLNATFTVLSSVNFEILHKQNAEWKCKDVHKFYKCALNLMFNL